MDMHVRHAYGVATISRLLQIIGLFGKRALYKRRYSAKETYNFKEPINRSHPTSIRSAQPSDMHIYSFSDGHIHSFCAAVESLESLLPADRHTHSRCACCVARTPLEGIFIYIYENTIYIRTYMFLYVCV